MKKYKKLLSLLLVAALTVTTFSVIAPTQAKKTSKAKVSSVKFKNTKKKLTLNVGQTFKLKTTVKVSPNKAKNKKLKFTTSNKKVVTVSKKGVLKAKKAGTAKITAASKINKKKKAVLTVTVKNTSNDGSGDVTIVPQTPSDNPSLTPPGTNQTNTPVQSVSPSPAAPATTAPATTAPATTAPVPTESPEATNKPMTTDTPKPVPTSSTSPTNTPSASSAPTSPAQSQAPADLTPPDFVLVNAIEDAKVKSASTSMAGGKIEGTTAVTSFTEATQYSQVDYKLASPFSLETIDKVEFKLTVTGTPDSVSFKLLDADGKELEQGSVTQYNKKTGTYTITLSKDAKTKTVGGFAIMTNSNIEGTTQTATATLEYLKFVKTAAATTAPSTKPTTSPTTKPISTPGPALNSTIFESAFENGTDGWKLRWSNATTVEGGCTEDGQEDSTGHALKAVRGGGYDGPYLDLAKYLEPGATYTFTCWVKMDASVSSSTTLVLTTSFSNNIKQNFNQLSNWNKVTYSFTAPDDSNEAWLYFETWGETSPYSPIYVDNAKLVIDKRNEPVDDLPSLAETYKDLFPYFGVGAGKDSFLGTNGLKFIKSQFNSYTAGNAMKPDAIMTNDAVNNHYTDAQAQTNGYFRPEAYATYDDNKIGGTVAYPKLDFTTTDKLLKQAYDNGIKVRFHVLVWHQQTPAHFFKKNYNASSAPVSQDVMNSRLEFYVKTVMNHVLDSPYASVVYTFDVVNEYFHSHNAATNGDNTFWEAIYTQDADGKTLYNSSTKTMSSKPIYVKRAFKHAYDVLVSKKRTDISLIYNDYNTYDTSITSKIVDMIHWMNTQDTINTNGDKICSGVGMQSHLDINNSYHSVSNFSNALSTFKAGNFEIQITELDITNYEKDGKKTEEAFAQRYKDIMNAIITAKKNGAQIQSVTLWSLYDGVSWRVDGTPCIFTGLFAPKAAFYSLIDAAKAAK